MPSLWKRLWQDPPPTLACEFTAEAVGLARWSAGAVRLQEFVVRPLPPGALRPSPVRENLAQPEEVARAVASALEQVWRGSRGRRREIALLLPDLSGRVSVLPFDQLPAKAEEALSLVRFRLKKTLPFDVEEAALCFQPQGAEVLVAVTPHAVVRQYEAIFEDLGYEPGLVTLSTLAGLGLLEPGSGPAGATMLLRNGGRLLTIAICSPDKLHMLRTSELAGEEESPSVEEIFHDVYASAVYYQDHYGGQIERILLAGWNAETEQLAALAEAELGLRPRPLLAPARSPEQTRFLGLFGMLAEQARG